MPGQKLLTCLGEGMVQPHKMKLKGLHLGKINISQYKTKV